MILDKPQDMTSTQAVGAVRRIFDAYEDARPDRLILTKLDEAESLVPLLGVLRDRQIPISYMCAGQRVPEDLVCATPSLLAEAVLRESPMSHERVS